MVAEEIAMDSKGRPIKLDDLVTGGDYAMMIEILRSERVPAGDNTHDLGDGGIFSVSLFRAIEDELETPAFKGMMYEFLLRHPEAIMDPRYTVATFLKAFVAVMDMCLRRRAEMGDLEGVNGNNGDIPGI